jgi:hypothetical protein
MGKIHSKYSAKQLKEVKILVLKSPVANISEEEEEYIF